jgi:hypothetical protein
MTILRRAIYLWLIAGVLLVLWTAYDVLRARQGRSP